MKLLKVVEKHSNKQNKNSKRMFEELIEMTYQYCILGSYQNIYRVNENAYNEFFSALMHEVESKPFEDVLGELMTELNVLNFGKNSKLCQNITPFAVAESVSKLLNRDRNKSYSVGDICCGTGVLVLAELKQHYESKSKHKLSLVLNDLDDLMCKITTIQIEINNFVNVNFQFTVDYIVYNHDAILGYKFFCRGITDRSKIVGCSTPSLI